MFKAYGKAIVGAWPVVLLVWVAVLATCWLVAPSWESVAQHGNDEFFSPDAPSRQAEALFDRAFPGERRGSRIVIVACRDSQGGLTTQDKRLITADLKPRLEKIAQNDRGRSRILRIRALDDKETGPLLLSADGQAAITLLDVDSGPLDPANGRTISAVERVLNDLKEQGSFPQGLSLSLSGSAVLGYDVARAEIKSAEATKGWTIGLVVALLLLIYRAPILVFIPLATVFVAVELALKVLQLASAAGWINLFEGIQVYVIVLGYGAGVDYCLFLISRFREEMACGENPNEAVAQALAKVGVPISASAATVICGIGMMAFARFGKIHDAGIVIPISLVTVLFASMSFTPALLRLVGRAAFWPRSPHDVERQMTGLEVPKPLDATAWRQRLLANDTWRRVGGIVICRPATIWIASMAILSPLALLAVLRFNQRDYGIIESVPKGSAGLAGTLQLKKHFPEGTLGNITILVRNDQVDFRKPDAKPVTMALTRFLIDHRDELGLADIRTVDDPLGITESVRKANPYLSDSSPQVQEVIRSKAMAYYVTNVPDLNGHVMRVELVPSFDPLATSAIARLNAMEQRIYAGLRGPQQNSQLFFEGSTASLRDLQNVSDRDQNLIGYLVPGAVFLILLILLRSLVVSIYLIASVIFSYLVTMGATALVFWASDPGGFVGLDWRTPLFLFTILVAVGEDYNIFLMTRIHEEQRAMGKVAGIAGGLARTGAIISSCGMIMAGTFGSLMAGTLPELKQMGFALAFGVLLDTLVIRTVIVPAFLVLYEEGRLNIFRRDSISSCRGEAMIAASAADK